MANFDRAHQDHDERDYDGGPDDDENEGSHLPVVIIIAVIVLAAFGGVVWLAYNQGVARGRSDVPVHVATAGKADDGGIKVYQQSAGPDEDKAAAPPAAPAPAPEASQTIQPPSQPAASPPAAAPSATATPAAPPLAAPKAVATQPAVMPKPVTPPPAAPKSQPQVAVAKPYSQPANDEPARPQVATKAPAQLGGAHPAAPTATTPAPATVAKVAPVKPVTPPAPAKTAASGSYLLQIGAYKSEDDARAAWKAYQSKHAALLNGFSSDVQRTTHDDGSTWYRLRIASFSDKDAAAALCERLKSQGGACFLSK
jgi:hypothetical protein